MVFVHLLLEAAKAGKSVQNFVEGGALVTVLSAFGNIEYVAARGPVADLALPRNPEGPPWSAVNHLQSAHMAYRAVYAGRAGVKAYLGAVTNTVALNKDLFTLCLMAVCYRYLGEIVTDAGLRRQMVKNLMQGVVSLFNAGTWAVAAKLDKSPLPQIYDEQFAEFTRPMLADAAPAARIATPTRAAKCRACGRRRRLSDAGLCRECRACS